jgi:hypothetical protein
MIIFLLRLTLKLRGRWIHLSDWINLKSSGLKRVNGIVKRIREIDWKMGWKVA